MTNLIDKILSRKEFIDEPPVLIDIGASGAIDRKWKVFAKYSICLAFDADEREFGYVTKENDGYKKLYIFNCIVTDTDSNQTDFFLTASPFCSSVLPPDNQALNIWSFADKFNVDKKVKLKTRSLSSVLTELNIKKVDWFKTDSQGTDLRLFLNIDEAIRNKCLAAEFEPGIINAYLGEDKLYKVFDVMNNNNFWLADMKVKGSQRISPDELHSICQNKLMKKLIAESIKSSPCWGELTYLNTFNGSFSKREYLLGWIFSSVMKQHGFSYHLALKAKELFEDPIFSELAANSRLKILSNVFKLKFFPAIIIKLKKLFHLE
ncbi:MAG: hypothetical protein M0P61_02785 [Ignavibacteriaceae bacterium]|nr:hypothetical protein [Ignavibacteriaceae bacterium]